MHKVVIERPRWNPGPTKKNRRANLADELLPKCEGIKRPYSVRKGLTDLLGPLRRWLHSQVGRPWNDVYSEACEVIKPNDFIRIHVKTHLLEFVERNTFMHDGDVCVVDTWRCGGIVPVTARRFRWSRYYVHPLTGTLLEIDDRFHAELRRARQTKPPQTAHWLSEVCALKKIKGIWYTCRFLPVDHNGPFRAYDHVAESVVGRGGLEYRRGIYLHCVTKQQLSKRDLRMHGLFNDVPEHSIKAQSSVHPLAGELTTALSLQIACNVSSALHPVGRAA